MRQYRSELKGSIEAAKNTCCLQLDSLFDTLNGKSIGIETRILANIEASKESRELCKKSQSLTYDLSSSIDTLIDDLVRQIAT